MNKEEKTALRKKQNVFIDTLSKEHGSFDKLLGELSQDDLITTTSQQSMEIGKYDELSDKRRKVRRLYDTLNTSLCKIDWNTLCSKLVIVEQDALAEELKKQLAEITQPVLSTSNVPMHANQHSSQLSQAEATNQRGTAAVSEPPVRADQHPSATNANSAVFSIPEVANQRTTAICSEPPVSANQHPSATSPNTAASSTPAALDDGFSDDEMYFDHENRDVDKIILRLKPCDKHIKKLFDSDQVYKMSEGVGGRGRALIINNLYFQHQTDPDGVQLGNRHGSEMDLENVKKCFTELGLVVNVEENKKCDEMLQLIEQETKHPDHKKFGMFALVIMSHGDVGKIYGTDLKQIKLDDVYDRIAAAHFPQMAGKPKMVVIQACSGERHDRLSTDSCESVKAVEVVTRPLPRLRRIDEAARGRGLRDDLFIITPSFSGFVSYRHPEQGTWMVRALVEALYKHSGQADIKSIYEQVQRKVRRVANKRKKGQAPMPSINAEKLLYLFPGYRK